jgi:DNA replication protein
MKVFSGFPAGKLQVTPLPNVFFTDLLLTIDDVAELKLTLHLFWLFAERAKGARSSEGRSRAVHIRASELRADPTLMESLKAVDPKPEQALIHALARATERGTLLHLDIDAAEGGPGDALFFLNSEAGRRESERLARQLPPAKVGFESELAGTADRPNIFVLYEQNIGTLTPLISEELKEAEREYPADWIQDAFKIAVKRNVRRWDYVSAILKRWKTEGRSDLQKKSKPWWDDEYDQYVNR